jgi:hypothetical protein
MTGSLLGCAVKYTQWRILNELREVGKRVQVPAGKAVMLKPADYPWFPGISVDSVADKMTKHLLRAATTKTD